MLFTPTLTLPSTVRPSAAASTLDNFYGDRSLYWRQPCRGPIDGKPGIIFRLSDELVDQGADSRLLGGLLPIWAPVAATLSLDGFNAGATTGTIVFRAVVQEDFSDDFPSADRSVDERDILDNRVSIQGDVLAYADLTTTGQSRNRTPALPSSPSSAARSPRLSTPSMAPRCFRIRTRCLAGR